MALSVLEQYCIDELQRLYGGVLLAIDILPSMAAAATDLELKTLLREQFHEIARHNKQLGEAFARLDVPQDPKPDPVLGPMLETAKRATSMTHDKGLTDAVLLRAALDIQLHYAAGAGLLGAWLEALGYPDAAVELTEIGASGRRFARQLSAIAREITTDFSEAGASSEYRS